MAPPVPHDGRFIGRQRRLPPPGRSGRGAAGADVGEKLEPRADELTDDVQEVIVELIPDLRGAATDILHDSIRDNIETALAGAGDTRRLRPRRRAGRASSTPKRSRRRTWLPPR